MLFSCANDRLIDNRKNILKTSSNPLTTSFKHARRDRATPRTLVTCRCFWICSGMISYTEMSYRPLLHYTIGLI